MHGLGGRLARPAPAGPRKHATRRGARRRAPCADANAPPAPSCLVHACSCPVLGLLCPRSPLPLSSACLPAHPRACPPALAPPPVPPRRPRNRSAQTLERALGRMPATTWPQPLPPPPHVSQGAAGGRPGGLLRALGPGAGPAAAGCQLAGRHRGSAGRSQSWRRQSQRPRWPRPRSPAPLARPARPRPPSCRRLPAVCVCRPGLGARYGCVDDGHHR